MPRARNSIVMILVMAISTLASAADLEKAQKLYEQGRTVAAVRELQGIIDSDDSNEVKAAALDLLASIAVEEEDYASARDAWSRLLTDFPQAAGRYSVVTKLKLVNTVLGTTPQPSGGAAGSEISAVERRATAPPKPVAEVVTPLPTGDLVLVAGGGRPHDAAVEATQAVIDFLRQRGVEAVSATEGIPVVRDASSLVPMLVQKAEEYGAASALLLQAEFASRQRILLECFSPDGVELWQLKQTGGTGVTGREWSATGINYNLLERLLDELSEKVGGSGLPQTID